MLLSIIQHYDLISIYVDPQIFSILLFLFLIILFSLDKINIINHHHLILDLLFRLHLHSYLKSEILFIRV